MISPSVVSDDGAVAPNPGCVPGSATPRSEVVVVVLVPAREHRGLATDGRPGAVLAPHDLDGRAVRVGLVAPLLSLRGLGVSSEAADRDDVLVAVRAGRPIALGDELRGADQLDHGVRLPIGPANNGDAVADVRLSSEYCHGDVLLG